MNIFIGKYKIHEQKSNSMEPDRDALLFIKEQNGQVTHHLKGYIMKNLTI